MFSPVRTAHIALLLDSDRRVAAGDG